MHFPWTSFPGREHLEDISCMASSPHRSLQRTLHLMQTGTRILQRHCDERSADPCAFPWPGTYIRHSTAQGDPAGRRTLKPIRPCCRSLMPCPSPMTEFHKRHCLLADGARWPIRSCCTLTCCWITHPQPDGADGAICRHCTDSLALRWNGRTLQHPKSNCLSGLREKDFMLHMC